jgi:hypothetical protein
MNLLKAVVKFGVSAMSAMWRHSMHWHWQSILRFGMLTDYAEKLLSNGDKWEPELAAAIRADSPYR